MNANVKPDGLNFAPRVKEPESNLVAGMASPSPQSMTPTPGPGPYALQETPAWTYDFNPATGSARATFNGEVTATTISAPGSGVASFNTRTGAVTLTAADVTGVGGIVNPSPALAGTPTAPTAAPGTATTQVATTAFVGQALAAGAGVATFNGRQGAVTLTTSDVTGAGGAPTASPALTGTPTTATPALNDQSSKIASTQFVANAIASGAVTTWNGRQGPVTLTLSDVLSVGGAPIASPNFTGTPQGPTPTIGDASQKLATTAFVTNAVASATTGVASFNTRVGAVTLQLADVVGVGGAPLASPNLTGTPTAPTPGAADSSTKIATTAFVATALGGVAAGVVTFNGRAGAVTLQLTDVTSVGGAPIASPTFTGVPLTTTPAPGDNTTKIASTAFVAAAVAAGAPSVPVASTLTPVMNGTAAIGSDPGWSRGDHVHPVDTSRYAASNPAGYQTAAQVATATGALMPKAGGAFTGPITGTAAGFTGQITTGTLAASGGINCTTVQVLPGPGDAAVSLYDSAPTVRGQVLWQASTGNLILFNAIGGGQAWMDQATNFFVNGPAYKPSGGSWAATSDARIKTVTGDYVTGLAEVIALNPITFNYKGNDTPTADGSSSLFADAKADAAPYPASPHYAAARDGTTFVGLIAQEVEPLFPGMVTQRDGYIDGQEVTDLRNLDTSELIFALVNAVKELSDRLTLLEAGA